MRHFLPILVAAFLSSPLPATEPDAVRIVEHVKAGRRQEVVEPRRTGTLHCDDFHGVRHDERDPGFDACVRDVQQRAAESRGNPNAPGGGSPFVSPTFEDKRAVGVELFRVETRSE